MSLGLRKDYEQLEVGTLVALKSGGPTMTVVRATNHEGDVQVAWFHVAGTNQDGSHVYNESNSTTFPAGSLVRINQTNG